MSNFNPVTPEYLEVVARNFSAIEYAALKSLSEHQFSFLEEVAERMCSGNDYSVRSVDELAVLLEGVKDKCRRFDMLLIKYDSRDYVESNWGVIKTREKFCLEKLHSSAPSTADAPYFLVELKNQGLSDKLFKMGVIVWNQPGLKTHELRKFGIFSNNSHSLSFELNNLSRPLGWEIVKKPVDGVTKSHAWLWSQATLAPSVNP
jgi:hypothetical protein